MKDNWHNIPWKKHYSEVSQIQESIVMAYKNKDYKLVYQLQRKLVVSYASRTLAIRRVVTNSGSKTSGIDKQFWDSPNKRTKAIEQLRDIIHNPKEYKAQPLRRVWIPKENTTELRPLGIPTLLDRSVQAVYQMAVDPIVEQQSDPNSYGFRIYRSQKDAVARIRSILDKKTSPEWILDADVAKCFDKISHNFLLNNTIICDKIVLEEWLKCGIIEAGVYKDTNMGTPQGGIISPMLCNIALNGLEEAAIKAAPLPRRGQRNKIHLTRYADDFVCTSASKSMLETDVKEGISQFLAERGLEFKTSKTRIVNIKDGFDFLGFTFQRKPWNYKFNNAKESQQGNVLIIKPKKSKIQQLKDNVKKAITSNKPIAAIIRDGNPILRGWSEYYNISYHSLPIYWSLGHYVWGKIKMWKWARNKHPRRNAKWIFDKYVMTGGDRKWIFGKSLKESLFDISKVTHHGIFQIRQGLNPYLKENKEYYEERRQERTQARFRAAIYRKFKHICAYCEQSLYNGEPIELHHIIPQKEQGKWTMENIQPLHRICHQSTTYTKPKYYFQS